MLVEWKLSSQPVRPKFSVNLKKENEVASFDLTTNNEIGLPAPLTNC